MHEVYHYMIKDILSVDVRTSVYEASKLMVGRKIGSILVKEEGKYVGIFTETDLLRKVVAEGFSPEDLTISSVMRRPIISIDCNKSMPAAFLAMRRHDMRHIAVSEKDEIVGVLSVKDFSRYYIDKFG